MKLELAQFKTDALTKNEISQLTRVWIKKRCLIDQTIDAKLHVLIIETYLDVGDFEYRYDIL